MRKHKLFCLAGLILSAAFVLFLLVVIPNTRSEISTDLLEKIRGSNDLQEIKGMASLGISVHRSAQDTGRVLSSTALTFGLLMFLLSLASLWLLRDPPTDGAPRLASGDPQTAVLKPILTIFRS